jgi:hypothetical protein
MTWLILYRTSWQSMKFATTLAIYFFFLAAFFVAAASAFAALVSIAFAAASSLASLSARDLSWGISAPRRQSSLSSKDWLRGYCWKRTRVDVRISHSRYVYSDPAACHPITRVRFVLQDIRYSQILQHFDNISKYRPINCFAGSYAPSKSSWLWFINIVGINTL